MGLTRRRPYPQGRRVPPGLHIAGEFFPESRHVVRSKDRGCRELLEAGCGPSLVGLAVR